MKIRNYVFKRVIDEKTQEYAEAIDSVYYTEIKNVELQEKENGYKTVFVTAIFCMGNNEFIEKTFDLFSDF